MSKRFFATLHLATGILIALGALGHSFGGVADIHASLAGASFDPRVVRLIYVVWHFAGMCMAVLGAVVIKSWLDLRAGRPTSFSATLLIGIAYLGFGVAALAIMREPFWSIFVVYGAMLCVSSAGLARTS